MKKRKDNNLNILKNKHRCNSGNLFIISGPSGSGKTTLLGAVLEKYQNLRYSISHTTRKPRKGEMNGVDYHFISEKDFKAKLKDDKWAEWAIVHDNYYGTSAEYLDNGIAANEDIILDIDVQGAAKLLKRYPDSVTIFILPRSRDTLRKRLESRGADSQDEIEKRLITSDKELGEIDIYRHVIINDKLSSAIEELSSIIETYCSGVK
ncbi:guanylate kinase [Thermodesulfobacteriota bacterium]